MDTYGPRKHTIVVWIAGNKRTIFTLVQRQMLASTKRLHKTAADDKKITCGQASREKL